MSLMRVGIKAFDEQKLYQILKANNSKTGQEKL